MPPEEHGEGKAVSSEKTFHLTVGAGDRAQLAHTGGALTGTHAGRHAHTPTHTQWHAGIALPACRVINVIELNEKTNKKKNSALFAHNSRLERNTLKFPCAVLNIFF